MASEQFIIPGTLANQEIRSVEVPNQEAAAKQLVDRAFGEILADNPDLLQLEQRVKAISPEISRGVYSDLLDIQVSLEQNRAFVDPKEVEERLAKI